MSAVVAVQPVHIFTYAGATHGVFHARAGEGLPEHMHDHNHATVCHAGSCIVRVKGKEIRMEPATQPIDLPANVPHEIEALENGTVFTNIFAAQNT